MAKPTIGDWCGIQLNYVSNVTQVHDWTLFTAGNWLVAVRSGKGPIVKAKRYPCEEDAKRVMDNAVRTYGGD